MSVASLGSPARRTLAAAPVCAGRFRLGLAAAVAVVSRFALYTGRLSGRYVVAVEGTASVVSWLQSLRMRALLIC